MATLRTEAPGLTPQADYEKSSSYHTVVGFSNRFDATLASAVRALNPAAATPAAATQSGAGAGTFYLDPADYSVGSKTLYLRLSALVMVNATAPASDFTVGLYPVSTPAGAATIVAVTFGTVVAGSQPAVFTAPAAGASTYAASADFAFPAAGTYVIGVLNSATIATSSSVQVRGTLQVRAV